MSWGNVLPFQSLLSALDNGTLEESISWINSTGSRAWIHRFHPGIAPQRTVKFSCFGNVGLERISCHWQAAFFLCCKCKWNRVPTFTPLAISPAVNCPRPWKPANGLAFSCVGTKPKQLCLIPRSHLDSHQCNTIKSSTVTPMCRWWQKRFRAKSFWNWCVNTGKQDPSCTVTA